MFAFEAAETQGASVVLKRADAPYLPDGPPWLLAKAARQTTRVLLLSARPGGIGEAGPRYSIGVLRDGAPAALGDAACPLAGDERGRLDRWVRARTTGRYGPVRAVEPALVLEVAFDSVRPAPRRRAGLALERPEIVRILWDLPPDAADGIERLTEDEPGLLERRNAE